MRLKLIESGCIYELFKELRSLTRLVQAADPQDDSNKVRSSLFKFS